MCRASLMERNQHTSSNVVPLITKELALNQMFSFFPLAHLSCHTLIQVSSTMHVRRTSSSHPWVTALTISFITPIATHSHPYLVRWPTSLPHREKMVQHVMTSGMSRMAVLHLHTNLLCFFHILRSSTWVPFLSRSWFLQTKPN